MNSFLVAPHRGWPAAWLVAAVASLMVGCSQEERIRTYRVAKEDQTPRRVLEPTSGAPQVMLGAIIPDKDAAWFFKLQAAPEIARAHRDDFLAVVESVNFGPDGRPRWKLPEGWSERIEQGITYARLTKPSEGLVLTVTQLPVRTGAGAAEWERYVLDNINRWRGQLGLPAAQWGEIQSLLKELPALADGERAAYWIELEGQAGGGGGPFMGAGRMPGFAPGPGSGESDARPAESDPAERRSDAASAVADAGAGSLEFDAPAHWQAQDVRGSSMRLAAFRVDRQGQSGEVTLVEAGGDIRANLGIWFGQVGVQPDPGMIDQVVDSATTVNVNGVAAKVYLVGGSEAGQGEAILVADIPRGAQSLFVKMKGDAGLVQAEREAFERFVASIQW
ncbi:MAG: hypothetical protein D6753_02385 [Planctomycetota bacterium]|nr:MAG: hypothetical protein D6753_02385 [Planctomycetota bacterium]